MNLSFALPGMLWALAALAVPLLLHLVRRERRQRTVFAALAWLDPRQRPRRRLRLRDWLLLLLRLLLVTALVLLLAGLQREDAPAPGAVTLVHPALPAPAGEPPPGEQWAWLAPGFPAVATPAPSGAVDVPSLLREIDQRLPADTRLAVQVPSVLDGLDAAPIRLSRAVDWQVQAPDPRLMPAASPPPLALALRGVGDEGATRWLRAVHAAWQAGSDAPVALDVGPVNAVLPAQDTVLAWTAARPPDEATLAWAADGGTLLLDAATPWPLARAPVPLARDAWLQGAGHGAGRVLQWRTALDPAALPALLEADFPARLREQLQPAPTPARADARAVAPAMGAAAPATPPQPLDTPLLWLALALFAIERVASLWPARSTPR